MGIDALHLFSYMLFNISLSIDNYANPWYIIYKESKRLPNRKENKMYIIGTLAELARLEDLDQLNLYSEIAVSIGEDDAVHVPSDIISDVLKEYRIDRYRKINQVLETLERRETQGVFKEVFADMDDNTCVVVLRDKKGRVRVGTATCSGLDEFDDEIGFALATVRALGWVELEAMLLAVL